MLYLNVCVSAFEEYTLHDFYLQKKKQLVFNGINWGHILFPIKKNIRYIIFKNIFIIYGSYK